MGSLNTVTILGRLGRDAELRYAPGGSAVSNFSVATSETWKDKDSGERKEKTEWHKVVLWGKSAESINQYLTKGREVCVVGKLETRTWDKDGQKHYATEIKADRVVLVGGGGQRQEREDANQSRDEEPRRDITDDDIPF